jgi:hypothetical protein
VHIYFCACHVRAAAGLPVASFAGFINDCHDRVPRPPDRHAAFLADYWSNLMKAVAYRGPNQVAVEDVPAPRLERPTDAIVKITSTNICGSDLHMYEGRTDFEQGRVKPSFIVSHELTLDQAPAVFEAGLIPCPRHFSQTTFGRL